LANLNVNAGGDWTTQNEDLGYSTQSPRVQSAVKKGEITWRALSAWPDPPDLFVAIGVEGVRQRQGLTLVDFSAQFEPFLAQSTPPNS
jgi:hypothetical protein